MPRENTTQGVSFTPELLAQAKARAAEMGLSLSGYIQQLIRANLRPSGQPLDADTLSRIAVSLEELVALKRDRAETQFAVAEEATSAPLRERRSKRQRATTTKA